MSYIGSEMLYAVAGIYIFCGALIGGGVVALVWWLV
jgi:hypothetical protein